MYTVGKEWKTLQRDPMRDLPEPGEFEAGMLSLAQFSNWDGNYMAGIPRKVPWKHASPRPTVRFRVEFDICKRKCLA